MLRKALRVPAAVGANITLIEQLAPAATLLPHVFVWEKSPGFVAVKPTLSMYSAAFPVLVRVTFCAALVVPTYCWLNVRLVGERLTIGAAGGGLLAPPQAVHNPISSSEVANNKASGRRRRVGEPRSRARASNPANNQSNPTGRRKLGTALGDWPADVLLAAAVVMVSVLLPAEAPPTVTDEGENVQVAPVGQPLARLRLTVPPNPYCGVTVIAELPACPGAEIVTGEGLADRLKSVTVIVTTPELEAA
jgi:hypothetical protein